MDTEAELSSVRTVQVVHEHGIHLRPAAEFVRLARRFAADISVRAADGARTSNGKSILALVALGASPGSWLTISAVGSDAASAIDVLSRFVTQPTANE